MITKRSRNNFIQAEVFRDNKDHQLYLKFSINKKRKVGKDFMNWLNQCSRTGFTIQKVKWLKTEQLHITVKPKPENSYQLKFKEMGDFERRGMR